MFINLLLTLQVQYSVLILHFSFLFHGKIPHLARVVLIIIPEQNLCHPYVWVHVAIYMHARSILFCACSTFPIGFKRKNSMSSLHSCIYTF